ncbi:MAG: TetR/AcrR family transcriptional regulator, partial [Eubacterium sp.]|nr:TetR/AcrR family transcriptional regulator [Eubacterium sp.]
AEELSMSKKTIYTVFTDKQALFAEMVDYCFDKIKESERMVMEDESLPTVEKLRKVLGVMPEGYQEIDLRQIYPLKNKFPDIYRKVEERLENGWEQVIELLRRGMAEGSIREVSIPLFKMIFEAAVEQFFQRDILVVNELSYTQALNEVVCILVDGIVLTENESNRKE